MGWSDDLIRKWADDYYKEFSSNKKIAYAISLFGSIINLILVIMLIIEPKAKILCPFVWSADLILLYYEIKYEKKICYPLRMANKIIKEIEEIEECSKEVNSNNINKRKLKKCVRHLNQFEKYMQKNYQKN